MIWSDNDDDIDYDDIDDGWNNNDDSNNNVNDNDALWNLCVSVILHYYYTNM